MSKYIPLRQPVSVLPTGEIQFHSVGGNFYKCLPFFIRSLTRKEWNDSPTGSIVGVHTAAWTIGVYDSFSDVCAAIEKSVNHR